MAVLTAGILETPVFPSESIPSRTRATAPGPPKTPDTRRGSNSFSPQWAVGPPPTTTNRPKIRSSYGLLLSMRAWKSSSQNRFFLLGRNAPKRQDPTHSVHFVLDGERRHCEVHGARKPGRIAPFCSHTRARGCCRSNPPAQAACPTSSSSRASDLHQSDPKRDEPHRWRPDGDPIP